VKQSVAAAGLPDAKTEDNAPLTVDAMLQSILGTGGERFGMAAAVLRGERNRRSGAPQGFAREGLQSASRSMIDFTLVPAPTPWRQRA